MKLKFYGSEGLNKIYSHYIEDFPYEERKPYEKLLRMLENDNYSLCIAEDKGIISGYMMLYQTDKVAFIDYFAISKEKRQCGYGSLFLSELSKALYPDKAFVLEIEKPDVQNDFKDKRKHFYEKNGFSVIDIDYKMPINSGSIPMLLMLKEREDKSETQMQFVAEAVKQAVSFVHSDYSHTENVINSYINELNGYIRKK